MVVEEVTGLSATGPRPRAHSRRMEVVTGRKGGAWFRAAASSVYRNDPNWTPPLPGEEEDAFAQADRSRRWVLFEQGVPIARVAAFLPPRHPGVGYFGFFECPDDPVAATELLRSAEEWLADRGCHECYGPIAGTPRDRIGLLIEGFNRPAMIFTPYNPTWYRSLLESAGYSAGVFLRAYGWSPGYDDHRGMLRLAHRAERDDAIRIRPIRPGRLGEETRLIATLVNETMAGAWHYDPIDDREAEQMARLLRPILDPRIALVAEDSVGPCGVALAVPDMNWLWRRMRGRVWPAGWIELLRWRRRIPAARMMALGLSRRVRGSSIALRMIGQLHAAGLARGFAEGELTQVFDDNHSMRRILERMGFPVVRRYAVFRRSIQG